MVGEMLEHCATPEAVDLQPTSVQFLFCALPHEGDTAGGAGAAP
jgi:hypothetical protein